MNERIRELAQSAGYTPFDSQSELLEKFAELIVKECAKIVDICSDEVPCSEGYDKFTVGKLKEHFGVTE